jgi:hypothetical protein
VDNEGVVELRWVVVALRRNGVRVLVSPWAWRGRVILVFKSVSNSLRYFAEACVLLQIFVDVVVCRTWQARRT